MARLVSAVDQEPMVSGSESMETRETLLRALQEEVYFEKTVAASYTANNPKHCSMALPAWFVAEHGDKFQKSVLLWSASSEVSWPVELSIALCPPSSRPEVKFTSGWRAFAAAHGLAIGDSLIFCLREMSEFDVYIFRVDAESSIQPTSVPASRKRSRNFKCISERLKEKMDKFSGYKSRRNLVAFERSAGRVNFFEKTLTACAVSRSFQLTLPTGFMHQFADKIQQYVALRSVEGKETWTMKVNIYFPENRPQFIFDCGAWKDFAVTNGLVEGDQVIFTLVAKSTFEVLILRKDANSDDAVQQLPSLHRSVKRSKIRGSAFSQTWQPPTSLKSRRQQHGKSRVTMERRFGSDQRRFAEKENAGDSVGPYSASDSSQIPSDLDSHTFEW